jgi:hypothetical protein
VYVHCYYTLLNMVFTFCSFFNRQWIVIFLFLGVNYCYGLALKSFSFTRGLLYKDVFRTKLSVAYVPPQNYSSKIRLVLKIKVLLMSPVWSQRSLKRHERLAPFCDNPKGFFMSSEIIEVEHLVSPYCEMCHCMLPNNGNHTLLYICETKWSNILH